MSSKFFTCKCLRPPDRIEPVKGYVWAVLADCDMCPYQWVICTQCTRMTKRIEPFVSVIKLHHKNMHSNHIYDDISLCAETHLCDNEIIPHSFDDTYTTSHEQLVSKLWSTLSDNSRCVNPLLLHNEYEFDMKGILKMCLNLVEDHSILLSTEEIIKHTFYAILSSVLTPKYRKMLCEFVSLIIKTWKRKKYDEWNTSYQYTTIYTRSQEDLP